MDLIFDLQAQPTPIPPWLLPSLQLLLGTSLVYRYGPLSAFAISYALYWVLRLGFNPPAGDFQSIYHTGNQIFGAVWRIVVGLLFQNGQDYTRLPPAKSDTKTSGSKTEGNLVPASTSPWSRFIDALEVGFAANRGVGWRCQVRKLPPSPPPDYPRSKFVFENLVGATWRLIAVDAILTYIRTTPLGDPSLVNTYSSVPSYLRLFRGVLLFSTARFSIDLLYRYSAALLVGLGFYDPSYWPPMMGRKRDGYTVRRFWSHTWHQMMRLLAEPPVYFFCHRVFRIRKGTYMSNYFKVFGAFFVAYAYHAYGQYLAGGSHLVDWNFFMSQAVAIWVEETVMRMSKGLGISWNPTLATWIGYAWTASFMASSATIWHEGYAAGGAYSDRPMGFGPTEMILQMLK